MFQCLKLSPNLRRQSKEVRLALLQRDLKKAGEMEIKKLAQLLSQVSRKLIEVLKENKVNQLNLKSICLSVRERSEYLIKTYELFTNDCSIIKFMLHKHPNEQ